MIFTFSLEGHIVPKARARITSRGNYHAQRYKDWMNDAISAIIYQRANKEGYDKELVIPCSIEILLVNPRKNADIDNIAGSIMDSLVKCKVLKNDNINSIDSLSISCVNIPTGVAEAIITITDSLSLQKEGG